MPTGDTGIETTLRFMAKLACRNSRGEWTQQHVRELTQVCETVRCKVEVVVDEIVARTAMPRDPSVGELIGHGHDADDAVIAAATACRVLGIPCRIVGARYGQGWTCFLSYQDGDEWRTVDVLTGKDVAELAKPDEQIVIACGEVEAYMSKDEEVLPNGVRVEVRNQTRYHVDKSVTLRVEDPEYVHPGPAMEVTVTGSVSNYEPKALPPKIQFASHLSCGASRKQWELMKRLGDQAWDEYEKRFPNG